MLGLVDCNKRCSSCKEVKSLSEFSCCKRSEDGSCKYYNSWCKSCANRAERAKRNSPPKPVPVVTEDSKECLRCHEVKLFSFFSPSQRGRKGLSSYCKPCAIRTPKEKARVNTKKYREKHRSKYLAQHRINQFNRKKLVKAQSDGTVTEEFLKFVYNCEYCCWCNSFVEKENRTLEHITELNNGGLHSVHNINMSCYSCNSSRLNKNSDRTIDSLFSKFIKEKNDNFS